MSAGSAAGGRAWPRTEKPRSGCPSGPGTGPAAGRNHRAAARQSAALADDRPAPTLACGSTSYRLHLLPRDTYPALPELSAPAGHADAAEFAAAVRQVIAASRDDTPARPRRRQVTFAAGAVMMAATDRYRAALHRLPGSRRARSCRRC